MRFNSEGDAVSFEALVRILRCKYANTLSRDLSTTNIERKISQQSNICFASSFFSAKLSAKHAVSVALLPVGNMTCGYESNI